ncbi:Maf family protein [Vibrio gallicus]|uniref:Maf family protein n=1 Tax=Vibrio gallicus TaxID=190897 RepID=UPI0021C39C10|nr:Maf family protein [Vibrio gallicus]
MNKSLILASGSPRRKELLSQLGYDFTIRISDIEEQIQQGELAKDYVMRLAQQKAEAVYSSLSSPDQATHQVLGADTVVTINNRVLEKPHNLEHSIEMLTELSGRQHQVMTAVCVRNSVGTHCIICITDVWFKPISQQEIEQYWQTGEPCDKAGSYGIQGIGGKFVTRIEGSYHSVVGLPLYETEQLLHQFL